MNRHLKVPASRHQLWGRTVHLPNEPIGAIPPHSFRAVRVLALMTDAESESRDAFLDSMPGMGSERSRGH
ncbi:MAG TPA: hypothetical protein VNU71_18025 [Burkholderiaceae bacterium]|nr:hypothetical protein [Burkholderiaceae bacterium]